jgi:hypothetical protein
MTYAARAGRHGPIARQWGGGCAEQQGGFFHSLAKITPHSKYKAVTSYGITKIELVDPPAITKEYVRKVLGPPDSVRKPVDSTRAIGQENSEAWCYGTNWPHKMATLGEVWFRNGSVTSVTGGSGEPPSPNVIGEAELLASLRTMSRSADEELDGLGPQRLIQAANLLISLGKA